MRNRALLVAAILVLSVAICGLSTAAEELINDSRKTAVAVRITFMTKVFITGHGREFDTVEPSSGLSDVFVFSGGEVRRNGTFEVEWAPGLAIKSVEWLEVLSAEQQEEMEEIRGCSCILSPGDSFESRLFNAYAGIVICLEPGDYTFSSSALSVFDDVTIRGIHTDMGVVQITGPLWLEPILGVWGSRLSLENISWVSLQIMVLGSAAIDIKTSNIRSLVLTETSSANVVQSSLGYVLAKDGTTTTFTECIIDGDGPWSGISASGYAVVSVIDSIIRNASTGISARGHATVRVTRGEFVDCGTNTRKSDSGVIEID